MFRVSLLTLWSQKGEVFLQARSFLLQKRPGNRESVDGSEEGVIAIQKHSDVLLQLAAGARSEGGKDRLSSTAAAESWQLQHLQHSNSVNSLTQL